MESLGYYLPWVLSGTILTTIAYGLLSLVGPSTPVQQWVEYQILFGVGCGAASTGVRDPLHPQPEFSNHPFCCSNASSISYRAHELIVSSLQSYIAIQNLVPAAQIPIAMAILIFCGNLGAGVFLIAAQTFFSNTLREQIEQHVPGVNSELIIAAGARSVRQLVSGEQLAGVLQAYSTSVDRVMYLGIGIGAASFAFAWGLGWKDIRVEKKKVNKSEIEVENDTKGSS